MKRIDPSQQVINLAAALHELHDSGPMDSVEVENCILASIKTICTENWLAPRVNVPDVYHWQFADSARDVFSEAKAWADTEPGS